MISVAISSLGSGWSTSPCHCSANAFGKDDSICSSSALRSMIRPHVSCEARRTAKTCSVMARAVEAIWKR